MATYSVYGLSAATVATVDHAVAQLWNPDAADAIRVLEVHFQRSGITGIGRCHLTATTAEGTAGSTVTPDADNCWDDPATPPSGARLTLAAFSVQPTLAAPRLWAAAMRAVTGSEGVGFMWTSAQGITVPPGRGLALVQSEVEITPASTVTFVWDEA